GRSQFFHTETGQFLAHWFDEKFRIRHASLYRGRAGCYFKNSAIQFCTRTYRAAAFRGAAAARRRMKIDSPSGATSNPAPKSSESTSNNWAGRAAVTLRSPAILAAIIRARLGLSALLNGKNSSPGP